MLLIDVPRRRLAQVLVALLALLVAGPLLTSDSAGAREMEDLNQTEMEDLNQTMAEIVQTEDPAQMAELLPDDVVAEMPDAVAADFTMTPDSGGDMGGDAFGLSGSGPEMESSAATMGWAPCAPPAAGGRQCPLPGYPQPYGFLPSNWRNNFGMPDLPVPGGNYCTFAPDRIPFLYDFRGACYQHDLAYVFTPVSRSDADRLFLDDMKRACRAKHGWWNPLRYVCYAAAYIYYAAVRIFGGSRFGVTPIPGFNVEAPSGGPIVGGTPGSGAGGGWRDPPCEQPTESQAWSDQPEESAGYQLQESAALDPRSPCEHWVPTI